MRKASILFMLVLGLSIAVGCGGGDGDGISGTAPVINLADICDASWNPSKCFTIGEFANLEVDCWDPDLDMKTLYVSRYYPSNASTPYYGPDYLVLSTQVAPHMIYHTAAAIEVAGPGGSWRVEFQIEDAVTHESNIYDVYAFICSACPTGVISVYEFEAWGAVQLAFSEAYYTANDPGAQMILATEEDILIDGVVNTGYVNLGPAYPADSVGGDLGSAQPVSRLRLYGDHEGWSNFRVLYNTANTIAGWTEVNNLTVTKNREPGGLGGKYTNEFSFDPVSARWWKVWAAD